MTKKEAQTFKRLYLKFLADVPTKKCPNSDEGDVCPITDCPFNLLETEGASVCSYDTAITIRKLIYRYTDSIFDRYDEEEAETEGEYTASITAKLSKGNPTMDIELDSDNSDQLMMILGAVLDQMSRMYHQDEKSMFAVLVFAMHFWQTVKSEEYLEESET